MAIIYCDFQVVPSVASRSPCKVAAMSPGSISIILIGFLGFGVQQNVAGSKLTVTSPRSLGS